MRDRVSTGSRPRGTIAGADPRIGHDSVGIQSTHVTAKPAREVLLEKVLDYCIEHGVGDTSLRALASEIGTSHRMLIYHFGSREGLLTAVVDHIWESQQATLEQLADTSPDDPAEGAWLFWQMLVENSAVAPLVFEMSAPAMHGAPWTESFRVGSARLVERVAARLVAFGEPGEHAEVLARMCVAVMHGALWELRITGDTEAANVTVRAFLDATWPASTNR